MIIMIIISIISHATSKEGPDNLSLQRAVDKKKKNSTLQVSDCHRFGRFRTWNSEYCACVETDKISKFNCFPVWLSEPTSIRICRRSSSGFKNWFYPGYQILPVINTNQRTSNPSGMLQASSFVTPRWHLYVTYKQSLKFASEHLKYWTLSSVTMGVLHALAWVFNTFTGKFSDKQARSKVDASRAVSLERVLKGSAKRSLFQVYIDGGKCWPPSTGNVGDSCYDIDR